MPKTKTLEIITSDEASEDIISWVNDQGYSPDEVFDDEDLEKRAVEHGYVKDALKDTAVGPIPVSETA